MNEIDQIEQHLTIQNYVTTLFDSLPKVDLSHSSLQLKDRSNLLIQKLMHQNQLYGKKIIQLSDKFTSIYRKDHIFQRKDLQQKIRQIYKIVLNKTNYPQIDDMLSQIVQCLKYQHQFNIRNSKIQRQQYIPMVESKIQTRKSSFKVEQTAKTNKLSLPNLQQNNQNVKNIEQSRKQSIQSKGKMSKSNMNTNKNKEKDDEQITIKKVFKIKNYFQKQEIKLRQMFEQIKQKISQNKISTFNLSQEKLKYKKKQEENLQNLEDFIKLSTQNSVSNIQNIAQALNIVFSDYQKKIKDEENSQDKFYLYTKQIQKRQEVFSYAVSKMIDNITKLKEEIQHKNQSNAKQIIQTLLTIGQKFYQLYPSNIILANLKVPHNQKNFVQIDKKNYAVQVNTIKGEKQTNLTTEKRTNLELFKTQLKVQEVIQKYQKTIKFKKTIQQKEIVKILDSIIQLFPEKRTQKNPQMQTYQIELKKIMEINQKNEKELTNQYTKRIKKNQKRINELQEEIQKTAISLNMKDDQIRKCHKKIQNFIIEFKKQQLKKNQYEKAFGQVSQQIQRLKQSTNNQKTYYNQQSSSLKGQCERLSEQNIKLQKIKQQIQQQMKNMQTIISQQRSIYKEKIIILQRKQEQYLMREQGLKIELQKSMTQSHKSKQRIKQMEELYQQKIKKIQEMIQNIQILQKTIHEQESQNEELRQSNLILRDKQTKIIRDLTQKEKKLVNLQIQIEEAKIQAKKYKQIGLLNDNDIEALKEEMEKVRKAYQESQDNLQQIRLQAEQLQQQKSQFQEQNRKLCRSIDELRQQSHKIKNSNTHLQKEIKQIRSSLSDKQHELKSVFSDYQTIKKQFQELQRSNKIQKQNLIQQDHQLRQVKQELMKKKQEQNLDNGKRKLQFESLKIQLRKKTQQFAKLKQKYQQKIETLQHKNKELQQFISQKDLLSKISMNHQTQ